MAAITADTLSKAWACAGPGGQCSRDKLLKLYPDAPAGNDKGMVPWGDFAAWLLKKPSGSQELWAQVLKLRADTLLVSGQPEERRASLEKVWPDCRVVPAPLGLEAEAEKDELAWQECLVAFGSVLPPTTCAANHFLKVIDASLDANSVAFPSHPPRQGHPKPLPDLPLVGEPRDSNALYFPVPGLIGGSGSRPLPAGKFAVTAEDEESGRLWLAALARSYEDLRSPIHGEHISLILKLTPWPMFPLRLLDIPCDKKQAQSARVPKAWRFEAKQARADASYLESSRFLRGRLHSEPKALDMELQPWKSMEEGVIQRDECTEAQLTLIQEREARGPLSKKAIQRRRIALWERFCNSDNKEAKRPRQVVDPRFFEEVHPALEKWAALAEMRSRWAKDTALEAREYDEAAERGAQFVAWPTKGCWSTVDASWARFSRWFKMWRHSQAEQAKKDAGAGVKRRAAKMAKKAFAALPGAPELKRSVSGSSDSSVGSSWAVLSECSEASWQQVASEGDVKALQQDLKVSTAALDCLSKADIAELSKMCHPPSAVKLVIEAVCLCFGVAPERQAVVNGYPGKVVDDYWAAGKKTVLGDPAFLQRLCSFDKDKPFAPDMKTKLAALEARDEFKVEVVMRSSKAAAGLCRWVRALISYRRVSEMLAAISDRRHSEMLAACHIEAAESEYMHLSTDEQKEAAVQARREIASVDQRIKASDITELRGFTRPPTDVPLVCQATGLLLGNKRMPDWASAQKMMASPQAFIQQLRGYQPEMTSDEAAAQAKAIMSSGNMDSDNIKRKSCACAALAGWATNVLKYRALSKLLGPIASASLSLEEADRELTQDQKDDPEKVMLSLEAAMAALACLDKGSISEVKAYAKPPEMVMKTMIAVMTVMGKPPNGGWAQAKTELGDVQFLNKITNFDKDNISDATLRKIEKYTKDPEFTPERVANVSRAAATLCQWVHAMKAYAEVRRAATEPKGEAPGSAQELVEAIYKYHVLNKDPNAPPPQPLNDDQVRATAAAIEAATATPGLRLPLKKDLQEIKSMANPPAQFKSIFQAVIELMAGVEPSIEVDESGSAKDLSWKGTQARLSDPEGFLQKMRDFSARIEAGSVPQQNLEKVRKARDDNREAFDPNIIKRKGFAMAGVCLWVNDVLDHGREAMDFKPAGKVAECDVRVLDSPCSTALPSLLSPGASVGTVGTPLMTPSGGIKADLRLPSKKAVAELKAMKAPPSQVCEVVEAFAHLMTGVHSFGDVDAQGSLKGSWKQILSDVQLLPSIYSCAEHLEAGTVPAANIQKLRQLRSEKSEAFDSDNMKRKSYAAAQLCTFINDVLDYPGRGLPLGLPPGSLPALP